MNKIIIYAFLKKNGNSPKWDRIIRMDWCAFIHANEEKQKGFF